MENIENKMKEKEKIEIVGHDVILDTKICKVYYQQLVVSSKLVNARENSTVSLIIHPILDFFLLFSLVSSSNREPRFPIFHEREFPPSRASLFATLFPSHPLFPFPSSSLSRTPRSSRASETSRSIRGLQSMSGLREADSYPETSRSSLVACTASLPFCVWKLI